MNRPWTALALILVLTVACADAPPAPLDRTPVPTWTLPFRLTETPVSPLPGTLPAVQTATSGGPVLTATPIPPDVTLTASPTARPGIDPTLGAATPNPFATLHTPIPPPMAQLYLDPGIVNILLLGRDTPRDSNSYRTDVIIIASINKQANSVTLLTLPRDLFVYVPGWTMNRINTAAAYGDSIGYPGGGVALLEQTILYNLGIPVHGWARVDFEGFKAVTDILGGVDVPVSCEMTDWRLKDPALDPQNADNWELFTMETGVQHMSGDTALWYARSRKRSSDFDRSRRQHQVLRAMFDKALQLNALAKVPELYGQYVKIVDTDMGLGDVLQFVPLAVKLDRARIKSRFLGRSEVYAWTTPAGAAVLLPDRDAIARLLDEAFRPPSENILAREAPAVEIWNGTLNADWTALAADNLAWAGIIPVAGQADAATYSTTTLYDFTTSPKGSARNAVQDIFHISDANVVSAPDPNAPYPFRVVLGSDYNSCVRPASAPRPTATPGPAPLPNDVVHAAAVLEPPPGIDGDLSEWAFLPYPATHPVFGVDNWQGPTDLSALWNAAWDEDYLYLALEVSDDTFVQLAAGQDLFRGDSLELLLNIDPGKRTQSLSERDFQLGISARNLGVPGASPEAYLWLPEAEKRAIGDVVVGARLVPGGYHLEVAVPWSIFRVIPFPGEGFGFSLSLSDDDSPGGPEQESLVSSTKDRKLTDPLTWGILVLDPPP